MTEKQEVQLRRAILREIKRHLSNGFNLTGDSKELTGDSLETLSKSWNIFLEIHNEWDLAWDIAIDYSQEILHKVSIQIKEFGK